VVLVANMAFDRNALLLASRTPAMPQVVIPLTM
jgi:hypothetical protein